MGKFTTSSDFDQVVSGEIDGGITGNVSELNIQFSGESKEEPASMTEFEGFFEGGLIGKAGEPIELRILSDGSVFLWLNGDVLDLAMGSVDSDGFFDL